MWKIAKNWIIIVVFYFTGHFKWTVLLLSARSLKVKFCKPCVLHLSFLHAITNSVAYILSCKANSDSVFQKITRIVKERKAYYRLQKGPSSRSNVNAYSIICVFVSKVYPFIHNIHNRTGYVNRYFPRFWNNGPWRKSALHSLRLLWRKCPSGVHYKS